MDMRFGTWNIRSMYRAGSLRAVGEEISKYKLDFGEIISMMRYADDLVLLAKTESILQSMINS
jgi:hypothetical protein